MHEDKAIVKFYAEGDEEVALKAEYLHRYDDKSYNPITNNCEVFALKCLDYRYTSSR